MALFTDANIVTLDDLLQFEASLVQIASSHNINVETKVALSIDAISDKLMLWLLDVGASDPQFLNRRLLGLSTVVVTSTLQRWLCFDSLSRFYAEAYNVQLNTRFQAKWTEYQNEADQASQMFFMSGVGIVYNALPKPALPLISVQDGNSPAQAIFVQTAWTDATGNEGALSPVNGLILNQNSTIVVSMAEGATNAPAAAVGWNVYVSSSEDDLTRQNPAALPIGETWQLPSSGIIEGSNAIDGQTPQFYVQLSRQIRRG